MRNKERFNPGSPTDSKTAVVLIEGDEIKRWVGHDEVNVPGLRYDGFGSN